MASLEENLLTIAIPTYNRARYLDRCLNFVCRQLHGLGNCVELIVSDNASTDDTSNIVYSYQSKGYAINYIKNEKNLGFDGNFIQCYKEAHGKYVLALSDDDVLVDGSLRKILEVINMAHYGVVYLSNYSFRHDPYLEQPKDNLVKQPAIFSNPYHFIKRISYFITFISGNIINTEYLQKSYIENYEGTSLSQVSFILTAILSAGKNVYFSEKLIAMQSDNSGGYNLFKVFGKNFDSILKDVELKYGRTDFRKYIMADLFLTFFPTRIIQQKSGNSRFTGANPLEDLKKDFSKSYYYKYIFVPLFKLPGPFDKWYLFLIRIFRKIYLPMC